MPALAITMSMPPFGDIFLAVSKTDTWSSHWVTSHLAYTTLVESVMADN